MLDAPRELVHDEAFNVGSSDENYRSARSPRSSPRSYPARRASFAAGGGEPDKRSYRVDCSKIARVLPAATPQWTVRRGVEELREAYAERRMTFEEFTGPRTCASSGSASCRTPGRLDDELRWTSRRAG